jgi:hypothetical protein
MIRIRRWVMGKHRKVVWSEPQLPPYVKLNPNSPAGSGSGLVQPGDISMNAVIEEFLREDLYEDEDEPLDRSGPDPDEGD